MSSPIVGKPEFRPPGIGPGPPQQVPANAGDDLFISYVRKDAKRTIGGRRIDVVAELKWACERHWHPHHPHQRFRVCTDVDDFDLAGTLSDTIAQRIDAARALLLVSTQGVPARPIVHEEVGRFRAMSPGRPLMAGYVDLQPWDAMPAHFQAGTAAVDLAPSAAATLAEWRRQIMRESHKAVASAWGLKVKDVHDRFEADHKRMRRNIGLGVVGAAVLAVGAAIIAGGELGHHRVAELAIVEREVAPVDVGFAGSSGKPAMIGRKSIQVWPEARAARGGTRPVVVPIENYTSRAAFLPDGRIVLARSGSVELLDVDRGQLQPLFSAAPDEVVGLGIQPMPAGSPSNGSNDAILAIATKPGRVFVRSLGAAAPFTEIPRPKTRLLRRFPPFAETRQIPLGPQLAMSIDGKWLASVTESGILAVWNLHARAYLDPADALTYESENTRPIGAMIFVSKPSLRLLFSESTDGLRSLDLATRQITRLHDLPALPLLRRMMLSPDGRTLFASSYETLEILDIDDSGAVRWRQRIPLSPKSGPRLALAPGSNGDGTLLVGFFDARPEIYQRTYRVFGFDIWPLAIGRSGR